MTVAIVTVLLTFVLTGIIGNLLVHRWQHRYWLNQQQFLGEEKEYLALKLLSEELASATGKRQSQMRRLLTVLRNSNDDLVRKRFSDYDAVVAEWNATLNSFLVRLTLYASHHLQFELEHDVQTRFWRIGTQLEQLTAERLSGGAVSGGAVVRLNKEMDQLSRRLFEFNRDLLKVVRSQKTKTYYGVSITFEEGNLSQFTTWELFKALFKPRIESLRVVRTPADLKFPTRSGS